MSALAWAVAYLGAYLCGSIPSGLLIGFSRGVDLRREGSGNIGATNCGRVLGYHWGTACFIFDLLKGGAPVLATGAYFGFLGASDITAAQNWAWLGVGVAAMLGHIFPVWLRFRGGKGVATGLGVVLGVWPALTLPACGAAITWLIFASTLRFVSLASVVAAALLPLYVIATAILRDQSLDPLVPHTTVAVSMALLVTWRHRSNLGRLWNGLESRLGAGREKESPKKKG